MKKGKKCQNIYFKYGMKRTKICIIVFLGLLQLNSYLEPTWYKFYISR